MLADFTLMTFFEETCKNKQMATIRKRLFELYHRYNHTHPDVKNLYTIFDNVKKTDTKN